tara:strand:- start:7100 stop:7501 length:402 start_codon:yes stop_codon:yes gene_type:complete
MIPGQQTMRAKIVRKDGKEYPMVPVPNVQKALTKTSKAKQSAKNVQGPNHCHVPLPQMQRIVLRGVASKAMFSMWKLMGKKVQSTHLVVKFAQTWCCYVQDARAMTIHAMVTGTAQSVTNADMDLRAGEWANV